MTGETTQGTVVIIFHSELMNLFLITCFLEMSFVSINHDKVSCMILNFEVLFMTLSKYYIKCWKT